MVSDEDNFGKVQNGSILTTELSTEGAQQFAVNTISFLPQ